MKLRFSILAICIILMMTSCTINSVKTENKIKITDQFTPEIISTEIPPAVTSEPQNNSIGDDPDRIVDGFQVKSLDEIDSLSVNKSSEKYKKLDSYNYEKCYFVLNNPPQNMIIDFIAFSEVGFFTFYSNDDTGERLNFHWWTYLEPNAYIKELDGNITRLGTTLVEKNGITYYCNIITMKKEPSDTTTNKRPYAEIRWVEDNKCFYVSINSASPLDESVLDYCQIEKHAIG